jgi:hypothetical protein
MRLRVIDRELFERGAGQAQRCGLGGGTVDGPLIDREALDFAV